MDTATEAEHLEAMAREHMAALPKARGWDSRRAREDDMALLDALLDAYNEVAATP